MILRTTTSRSKLKAHSDMGVSNPHVPNLVTAISAKPLPLGPRIFTNSKR